MQARDPHTRGRRVKSVGRCVVGELGQRERVWRWRGPRCGVVGVRDGDSERLDGGGLGELGGERGGRCVRDGGLGHDERRGVYEVEETLRLFLSSYTL